MYIDKIEYGRKAKTFRLYDEDARSYHILLLTKSEMVFGIEGGRERRPAGQAVFYRPCDIVDFEGVGEYMTFDFVGYRMSRAEAEMFEALPLPFVIPVAPPNFSEATTCVKILYYLFYSTDRYRLEKIDVYLRNLMYALASGDDNRVQDGEKGILRHRMEQLRRMLSDDPAQFRFTRQAADSVGISVSRFEHLYRSYFGLTFVQDLIRARIRRACVLLRTTDWTVSKIAAEVGYESEAHFYRQFKREMGQTPSEYRSVDTLGF